MKTLALRSALTPVSAAALLLLAHTTVAAQTTATEPKAEEGEQKLETVVITGSRIRGLAPVGAAVNSADA